MFKFHVITGFPEMFQSFTSQSIIKRAIEAEKISVNVINVRDFAEDKHHKTDDRPYGGGPGMVMYAEPILKAVEKVRGGRDIPVIITSCRGKKFSNVMAESICHDPVLEMIIVCGHYEGIDARVKKILKAKEVSVGSFTLTGGELPAMVMIDAISRRLDGVLGNVGSIEESRTASGSVYTRPEILEWKGKKYRVPKILLSGNHSEMERWRETH